MAAAGVIGCGDERVDPAAKIEVSDATRAALAAGERRAVVVGLSDEIATDPDDLFDDAARAEAAAARATLYRDLADAVDGALPGALIERFDHLPYAVAEVGSLAELERLAELGEVERVLDDAGHRLAAGDDVGLDALADALLGRPEATVALLDTGVDFRAGRFACAAAGEGCAVVAAAELAADDRALDADGHGTRVASAIRERLPRAGLAALDVVGDDGRALTSDLLAGIEWAIAHRASHEVAGIALALADDELDGVARDVVERGMAIAGESGVGSRVAARALRNAREITAPIGQPIAHAAPTGLSIMINAGDPVYATSTNVSLFLSATGATQMCLSNTTTCTTWVTYATTKAWVLTSTSGVKQVRAWFRNAAGEVAGPVLDGVVLDKVNPINGSLAVLPQYQPVVPSQIRFTWLATSCNGVQNIRFSIAGQVVLDTVGDTGSCTCVPSIRTAVVTSPAAIALLQGNTTNSFNTIFGEFGSSYLAWAVATIEGQDTVLYDFGGGGHAQARTPDLCTAGYTSNINATASVFVPSLQNYDRLSLSWNGFSDFTAGLAGYKLQWGASEPPAQCTGAGAVNLSAATQTYTITGLTEGQTTYVRLCPYDFAGNVGPGVLLNDTLGEPAAPPSASTSTLTTGLHINGNAELTGSAAVTLTMQAKELIYPYGNPTSMCISNTSTCTAWQAFASPVAHTLTAGAGLKSVYARFRDSQGNESRTPFVDTITVDNAAPTNGKVTISSSGGVIRMNWSGFTDLGAGVVGYKVVRSSGVNPPAINCPGTDLNAGRNVLSFADSNVVVGQSYPYRVCAIDGVGLVSSGVAVTKQAAN